MVVLNLTASICQSGREIYQPDDSVQEKYSGILVVTGARRGRWRQLCQFRNRPGLPQGSCDASSQKGGGDALVASWVPVF
jgi:hypothetical protein